MKKLLPSALLALAAFGFVTGESFAGCFGLIPHHGCCGCCKGATFSVRQYNAFSPVACGSLCLDGCAPFMAGYGGGYGGPCAGGMCPGGFCGLNYSGLPACSGCLGSLPASEDAAPANPSKTSTSNPVVTPSPLPSQMPSGPTSQIVTDPTIQSTFYPPTLYPASMQVQPQSMVAPSYWGK